MDFIYTSEERFAETNVKNDDLRCLFGEELEDYVVEKIAACFFAISQSPKIMFKEYGHFCFNYLTEWDADAVTDLVEHFSSTFNVTCQSNSDGSIVIVVNNGVAQMFVVKQKVAQHVASLCENFEKETKSGLKVLKIQNQVPDPDAREVQINKVFNNAVVCFKAFNYLVNKKTDPIYNLNDVFLFSTMIPKFFKEPKQIAEFFSRFNI